eukprot:scaffold45607_cov237-Amphora_coffeaeformis.AAC.17
MATFDVTVRHNTISDHRVSAKCLRESHCSYVASIYADDDPRVELQSFMSFDLSIIPRDANINTLYEFDDASAMYGDPVCPSSTCGGALVGQFDSNNQPITFTCPTGTVMEIDMTGGGSNDWTFEPQPGVEVLSLPSVCTGGSTIACQPGGTLRIRFAPEGEDCTQQQSCPYPTNGFAYGNCAANQECQRRVEALKIPDLTVPTVPTDPPEPDIATTPAPTPVPTVSSAAALSNTLTNTTTSSTFIILAVIVHWTYVAIKSVFEVPPGEPIADPRRNNFPRKIQPLRCTYTRKIHQRKN